jgi:ribose/xylose/arabinose/galactoside ABC-type transport system permease subunit
MNKKEKIKFYSGLTLLISALLTILIGLFMGYLGQWWIVPSFITTMVGIGLGIVAWLVVTIFEHQDKSERYKKE